MSFVSKFSRFLLAAFANYFYLATLWLVCHEYGSLDERDARLGELAVV